jgi:hypothetical protein
MCAAIKQYLLAEIRFAAASSTTRVFSDGPRRRTLLPLYGKRAGLSHDSLLLLLYDELQVQAELQGRPVLLSKAHNGISELVYDAVELVLDELQLDPDSEACCAFLQAAMYAGAHCCHC